MFPERVFPGIEAAAPVDPTGLRPRERLTLLADMIERGWTVPVRVVGSCMRPWVFDGDTVLVRPLRGGVKSGMIVLVRGPDQLLVHRAVAVDELGRVLTRGDLSGTSDGWWPGRAVLGQVVEARPGSRDGLPLDRPVLLRLGALVAPILRISRRLRSRAYAAARLVYRPGHRCGRRRPA